MVTFLDFNLSFLLEMSSEELEDLTDSGTTHTILRHRQLFLDLVHTPSSMTTMVGPTNLVQGRGSPTQFLWPNGTLIDVAHSLTFLKRIESY